MSIKIVAGDITGYEGDVIVNAANEVMLGGGGVDGAIHNAAGPALRKACEMVYADPVDAYGPGLRIEKGLRCATGGVIPTPAGNLKAKWVFHAVGPVWPTGCENEFCEGGPHLTRGDEARRLLSNCYRKSLLLAAAMDLKSIAFPAISTGVYGCPMETCASIALISASIRACAGLDITFYIHPAQHLGLWQGTLAQIQDAAKWNPPPRKEPSDGRNSR